MCCVREFGHEPERVAVRGPQRRVPNFLSVIHQRQPNSPKFRAVDFNAHTLMQPLNAQLCECYPIVRLSTHVYRPQVIETEITGVQHFRILAGWKMGRMVFGTLRLKRRMLPVHDAVGEHPFEPRCAGRSQD
jgi:hypothetical protein